MLNGKASSDAIERVPPGGLGLILATHTIHYTLHITQNQSLSETGAIDYSIELGAKLDLSGESPIFSDDIKRRIHDANYEMSALSTGIILEQNAIRFYEGEAQATLDPGVKEFYLKLADWERDHLDALMRQEDALKEDFWYESGFFPY